MKKFKLISLVLLASFLSLANCNDNPFSPKKKTDNTPLLLGLAYLASQQGGYEATVALVAKVKNADDTQLANSADAVALLTLTNKPGASNLILDNGKAPTDFTARAYSGTTAAADNGDISITFKVNAATGAVQSTLTQCQSCTGADYDSPTKYTKPFGSFDLNLNISPTGGTDTSQVNFSNVTGLKVEIKQVTISIRGQYNLQNPTVGENICDGKSVTSSPQILSGNLTTQTITGAAQLNGTVFVPAGVTLTVTAGSVVFGNRGSSLFVLPGGKLVSQGTKDRPVCFTSSQTPGSRFPSDWGGIVMIGNGRGTRSSTTEGTTPQNYGAGTDDADSSGSLEYTIVEFAGNEVAPGDELNGISMYTVGSGTKMEYVQVHRGLDDSFENWGGAVNQKYLLATGGLDDDYDFDEGYTGTVQYIIGHKYPVACGGSPSTDPHGFEIDGHHSGGGETCNQGNAARCTNSQISYFTMIGNGSTAGEAARLREGTAVTMSNGLFYNFGANNFIQGANNSGFPVNTFNIQNTVYGQSGKTVNISANATSNIQLTLTALPITSAGDTDGCGFGANKPDYTTNTASGAPATVGASGTGAPAKWWEGWTVYRAR